MTTLQKKIEAMRKETQKLTETAKKTKEIALKCQKSAK